MFDVLRQIARIRIVTEAPPKPAEEDVVVARLHEDIVATLGRALTIRHVDAGSCNACELEAHALMNPYYNIEGLGIRFVASPRHADALLVTGPVTKHMALALARTYAATPEPKLVIAAGECATHAVRLRAQARDDDDLGRLGRGGPAILLQLLAQPQTIEAAGRPQHDIEEHQPEALACEHLQRLISITGQVHLVSQPLQAHLQEAAGDGAVFDDQHVGERAVAAEVERIGRRRAPR